MAGTFVGRSKGGTVHVGNAAGLAALQRENSSTLSGESPHTLLMGVGGETNARYAMDANGVAMHGPGGEHGFDTLVRPPRALAVEWDPPALAAMGVATRALTVRGVQPGAVCSVSHESTAIASVAGAATLLWSAQVSGEDEVTVVVLNASPLLVDLPSGKMRLVVTHVEAL